MSKALSTRDFVRAMTKAGCTVRKCQGSHTVWYCGCGKHMVTVVSGHGTVPNAAIREVTNRIVCAVIFA